MIDPAYISIKAPEKIREPLKIYPLADEQANDLAYPSITYHYSVSGNGRYVYVIGVDPTVEFSQLFVWDLHRGDSRRYHVRGMNDGSNMKHLYETTATQGFLVCKTSMQFYVHTVRVRHWRGSIVVDRTIFRQPVSRGSFWSSARSRTGIVFVSQLEQFGNLQVTEIGQDCVVHSVVLSTPVVGLRFCGQPWMRDGHVYLFESSALAAPHADCKFLTGRLHRANLSTGQLDLVETRAPDGGHSPVDDNDIDKNEQTYVRSQMHMTFAPNVLIKRVKHVEREGWLWIIAETAVRPNDAASEATMLSNDYTRCRIYVLDMDAMRWRLLDWQPNCSFDELTLDVSDRGTVVLLRKRIGEHANRTSIDAFMLVPRRPISLVEHAFLALITNFPLIRQFSYDKIRCSGIPMHLLG